VIWVLPLKMNMTLVFINLIQFSDRKAGVESRL